MNLIAPLLQKTLCPNSYILDLYCQDLLPKKIVWQVENHLCDCEACSIYTEKYSHNNDTWDNIDATFEVKMFLNDIKCQPVAEYEAMLDMVLMSAATATVNSPTDGDMQHSNDIKFAWNNSPKQQLWLIVENNQYEVLFEGEIKNGEKLPLPTAEFGNGIYYYKLIDDNDLVKIGKFYLYR